MPFFVIKKGLVLLEWKYFPTPKILDPFFCYQKGPSTFGMEILSNTKNSRPQKSCQKKESISEISGTTAYT